MRQVISVANPKGGVAKTTTAVNLAAWLASQGKRVALFDMDEQYSSSMLAGMSREDVNNNPGAGIIFDEDIKKVLAPSQIMIKTDYGFDLLPGGGSLTKAKDNISRIMLGEQRLMKVIEKDKGLAGYDYIVIDNPAGKDRILSATLLASTHLLIPLNASKLALNDLASFVRLVGNINSNREMMDIKPLKILGVAIVLASERTKNNKEVVSELGKLNESGRLKVFETLIPYAHAPVEMAANKQSPVILTNPNTKISIRYGELFSEIFGKQKNKKFNKVLDNSNRGSNTNTDVSAKRAAAKSKRAAGILNRVSELVK